MLSINIIIILVTCLVSFLAFSNRELLNKLIFYPARIKQNKSWYEFISHGFIHADTTHLLFNMITLYFFGDNVVYYFKKIFGSMGTLNYLLLYFLGMILASVYSYFKHQDNPSYRSLGASGAVSAVLFAAIFFDPFMKIYIFFIPIGIPAIIFGPLYLFYSAYEANKGTSNIGHDAHFFGAVFGFIFPLILKPDLFTIFINKISNGLPF